MKAADAKKLVKNSLFSNLKLLKTETGEYHIVEVDDYQHMNAISPVLKITELYFWWSGFRSGQFHHNAGKIYTE